MLVVQTKERFTSISVDIAPLRRSVQALSLPLVEEECCLESPRLSLQRKARNISSVNVKNKNSRKTSPIMLLAIIMLSLFCGYHLLEFVSFKLLAPSDKRCNTNCRYNLIKIYESLSLYKEQYKSAPQNLQDLVVGGFITDEYLNCPGGSKVKFLYINFKINSKESEYLYVRNMVDREINWDEAKPICLDSGFFHNDLKSSYRNALYQDGTIRQYRAR